MLRMLLPVDGSESSLRAVDFAARKKDWYKDPVEIHLINVQPPLPFGSRVSSVIGHDTVEKYHREEAMKALEPAMHRLDSAGVTHSQHICVGDPPELIAEYAQEKGCDQIIMGSRGLGKTASLLLGSVATKVIHLSDVPVLLVK
jgi:nucleotide-binding universal stress UspA family protein